jgi:preprotein translocase subunit SecG
MLYPIIVVIHIIACLFLIAIVLIQSGRGGGLTETFSAAESIFGTKTNTFLVRATTVLSTIFFISCITLTFLSTQRSRSLMEKATAVSPTPKPVLPATVPPDTLKKMQEKAVGQGISVSEAQPPTANPQSQQPPLSAPIAQDKGKENLPIPLQEKPEGQTGESRQNP